MGVHIVHPGTRDVLRVFSFADIYRWGGTASLFSLVVWDTTRDTEVELQLWTREGPTIAGLVVEYINTIMEDRATPALPKRSPAKKQRAEPVAVDDPFGLRTKFVTPQRRLFAKALAEKKTTSPSVVTCRARLAPNRSAT